MSLVTRTFGASTANDRLSRAASEIMRQAEHEHMDYEMDGSGDCGPLIARAHQNFRVRILEKHGFTPKTYNEELARRLTNGGRMSYSMYALLSQLEVEPTDEWEDNHTVVCTLGYPGHPEAEYSTLTYLKGE